jgi:ParB-like chromosome segregation protein Spo0J
MLSNHPAADIFPLLDGDAYESLKADIDVFGLLEPICLDRKTKTILDGRNRYRACRELGIDVTQCVTWYDGDDPIGYVVSLNLHRRHLSTSQRDMVAARIAALPLGANQHAQKCAPSQTEAAELLNTSRRGVQQAASVLKSGSPDLVSAVENDVIPVDAAVTITKLPEAQQRAVVEKIESGEAKTVKQAVARIQTAERNAAPVDADFRDFAPQIYSVWNFPTLTTERPVFGSIPPEIIENLLYYFTNPGDLVIDPFGGSGSTIDACKRRGRQCYCSDLNPVRPDIHQFDVTTGDLIRGLDIPALVFLDPPYWRQAKGKYSDKETDLGNVSLDSYLRVISRIGRDCAEAWTDRPNARLALICGPCKDDGKYIDLPFLCYQELGKHLKPIQRITVPYSTQVHGGAYVQMAKDRKEILYLTRDLMIFGPG